MIIIGEGRVGGGLKRRAERLGVPATVISRSSNWDVIDPAGGGPILVCTNAGDLAAVIQSTPEPRLDDLVFVQNGMLDTFLETRGREGNTRGLLYFAVPTRGIEPRPGGESVFSGPHADSMATLFHALELGAESVTKQDFSNEMASKLIWNCVFGLLCDVFESTVGAICDENRDAVQGLVAELVTVANAGIHTTLDAEITTASLINYSMSISTYRGALKQWQWRNGWFTDAAQRLRINTPLHDQFLVGRRPDGR